MKTKNQNVRVLFDEKVLLKKCFSFTNIGKNRRNIYKMMYVLETNLKFIRMVLKYLLIVEKVPPIKVEKLILKWCLIISYYYFKEYYNYDVVVEEFENMLQNELTVDVLENTKIKSNELYGNIFNCDDESNNEMKKNIDLLYKHLSQYRKKDESTAKVQKFITAYNTKTLLEKDNYFFSIKNNKVYDFYEEFEQYDKNLSFDRLIAEVLANDNELVLFDFSIEEDEFNKLIKNYQTTIIKDKKETELGSTVLKKATPVIFGYMVFDIIKNNNFDYSKEIKTISQELFYMALDQTKCDMSINSFKYIHQNYIDNKQEISECEFIMNNNKYHFTGERLEKL